MRMRGRFKLSGKISALVRLGVDLWQFVRCRSQFCQVVERDQLRWELAELVQYTDAEMQRLEEENRGLRQGCLQFRQQVEVLQGQLDNLVQYIAEYVEEPLPFVGEEAGLEFVGTVDLASMKLGIVGGHGNMCREVVEVLRRDYGLQDWVEVPPLWQENIRQKKLRSKLGDCDLIVIVTGYMGHSLTENVYDLKEKGALKGEVRLLDCRGRSGVVREILSWASRIQS
jgi:hypothetical protein